MADRWGAEVRFTEREVKDMTIGRYPSIPQARTLPEIVADLRLMNHTQAADLLVEQQRAKAAPTLADPARDERLRRIQECADAATPGPWYVWRDGEREVRVGAPDWQHLATVSAWEGPEASAAFIAGARTDVPFLLADVTRLEAEVAQRDALLRELVDPDPCRFDHHGGCQAHGHLEPEPGEMCPHAAAKALLGDTGS